MQGYRSGRHEGKGRGKYKKNVLAGLCVSELISERHILPNEGRWVSGLQKTERAVEGKCLARRRLLAAGTCCRELGHSPSLPLGSKATDFLMETEEAGTRRDNELKWDSCLN